MATTSAFRTPGMNRAPNDNRNTAEITDDDYIANVFDDVVMMRGLTAVRTVTLPDNTAATVPAIGGVTDVVGVDSTANTFPVRVVTTTGVLLATVVAGQRVTCAWNSVVGGYAITAGAAGGGTATATPTAFVFRPGGVAGGNVYTTDATFRAAMAAQQGPRIGYIDTTSGAASLSGGNYGGAGYSFVGINRAATIANAALTWTGPMTGAALPAAFSELDLTYTGATTFMPKTSGFEQIEFYHCSVVTTAAGAFMRATATGALQAILENTSTTAGGAGECFGLSGAGANFFLQASTASIFIDANTLAAAGGGGFFWIVNTSAAFATPAQAGLPTGLITGATIVLNTDLVAEHVTDNAPLFGTTNAQSMIDAIKVRITTTAPTALTDADQTLLVTTNRFFDQAVAETANRVKTLSNTGAVVGDKIRITKRDGKTAFTLRVNNAAAAELATLPITANGFIECIFIGAAWQLSACGFCL